MGRSRRDLHNEGLDSGNGAISTRIRDTFALHAPVTHLSHAGNAPLCIENTIQYGKCSPRESNPCRLGSEPSARPLGYFWPAQGDLLRAAMHQKHALPCSQNLIISHQYFPCQPIHSAGASSLNQQPLAQAIATVHTPKCCLIESVTST